MNNVLFEKELKIIASEVDSPVDSSNSRICFAKAEGSYIFDVNDKKYIDLINGKGAVILGHNYNKVNKAIMKALNSNSNIHTGPADVIVELSHVIKNDIGLENSKITYFSTGTEACKAATSVAKMYTKKKVIISAGYHGWDLMWKSSDKFLEPNEYGVVDFYFVPQLLEQCIIRFAGDIALIIISPDYVYLEPDTLQSIIWLAKKNNILLCCDDVKQGYRYRRGDSISMVTNENADLYTFSKGLSNGNRISCLLGRADLMGKAKDFTYTSFYDTIPFYAAIETLREMKENNGYEYLNNVGKRLTILLNKVFAESTLPITAIGQGPMFQFVVDDDKLEESFYKECTNNGLLLFERDNQAVSCSINDDIINEIMQIINKVVYKLQGDYKELLGKGVSSERVFKTAWDMIDGAADIGTEAEKIKWIQELL